MSSGLCCHSNVYVVCIVIFVLKNSKSKNNPTDCCSVLITPGIFNMLVFCLSSLSSFPFIAVARLAELDEYRCSSFASDISGDDNWLLLQLFGMTIVPDMLFASAICDLSRFAPSIVGVFWFTFGQLGWWHLMRCGDNVNVSAFGSKSSSWCRYLWNGRLGDGNRKRRREPEINENSRDSQFT